MPPIRALEADVAHVMLTADVRTAGPVDAHRLLEHEPSVQLHDQFKGAVFRFDDSGVAELGARAGHDAAQQRVRLVRQGGE